MNKPRYRYVEEIKYFAGNLGIKHTDVCVGVDHYMLSPEILVKKWVLQDD